MATLPTPRLTEAQYLAIERASQERHQFLDGEMFLMSGASRKHNLIGTNLVRHLKGLLDDRPCEVYSSDMRVNVSRTGLYTYPDVVVVCGEPRFADDQFDALLNPRVIFEILSPSTENFDRGTKQAHYRQIPSLMEYVLVAQDAPRGDHLVRRGDDEWLLTGLEGLDATLALWAIDCRLPLRDIYAKVA
jgi:Uma2 family endonuclease